MTERRVFFLLTGLCSLLFLYNNCGKKNQELGLNPSSPQASIYKSVVNQNPSGEGSGKGSGEGGGTLEESLIAFNQTVYPLLRENCASCHGNNVSPYFAVEDVSQAHQAVLEAGKVDFNNIMQSRLVQRLTTDKHNCWTECDLDGERMAQYIQNWKDQGRISGDDNSDASRQVEEMKLIDLLDPAGNYKKSLFSFDLTVGEITSPMRVVNYGGISYLDRPNRDETYVPGDPEAGDSFHRIELPPDLPEQKFYFWFFQQYPNRESHCMFISVNGGSPFVYQSEFDDYNWKWKQIKNEQGPLALMLGGGVHQISMAPCKGGLRVQQILLTSKLSFKTEGISPLNKGSILFDLSSLATGEVFVEFTYREYDEYSFQLRDPRLHLGPGGDNLYMKNMQILMNGVVNNQAATFSFIDRVYAPPEVLLSERPLIIVKDRGLYEETLGLKFESLTWTDQPPTPEDEIIEIAECKNLEAFTNTFVPIKDAVCIGCHNADHRFSMVGDNSAVCRDALRRVNLLDPAASAIIQKPLNGAPFHGGGSGLITAEEAAAIEEWIRGEQ